MQLTVDTTLLYTLWKGQGDEVSVRRLVRFADEGHLDLAVTARVREDVPHPPYADRLNTLDSLSIGTVPDVARWDISTWGQTMWASDDFDARLTEAQQVSRQKLAILKSGGECKGSKPPNKWDWDHLHAHMLLQRDYFVTEDCGILAIADWLRSNFEIVVLTPAEALEAVVVKDS